MDIIASEEASIDDSMSSDMQSDMQADAESKGMNPVTCSLPQTGSLPPNLARKRDLFSQLDPMTCQ